MDGGSIERWKDDEYRAVYRHILAGDVDSYDPFEVDHRVTANMNDFDNACSFFRYENLMQKNNPLICFLRSYRGFQGWLATSSSGKYYI